LYFSSLPLCLALPFFQIFLVSTIYHTKHNFLAWVFPVDITWFPIYTSVFTSIAVPCDLSVKWRKASSLRSSLPVTAILTLCAPSVTCHECYRTIFIGQVGTFDIIPSLLSNISFYHPLLLSFFFLLLCFPYFVLIYSMVLRVYFTHFPFSSFTSSLSTHRLFGSRFRFILRYLFLLHPISGVPGGGLGVQTHSPRNSEVLTKPSRIPCSVENKSVAT
jgi:hypothetical protein